MSQPSGQRARSQRDSLKSFHPDSEFVVRHCTRGIGLARIAVFGLVRERGSSDL